MKMFKVKHINLAKQLLNSITEKNIEKSLENAKQLFEEVLGKHFADEIDKNGVLRYKSLTGPAENIQYFGILYENAPQSGVYDNFSLVLFPDNTQNSSELLLCYGIGTGGITEDAEWLGIPWVKRTIRLLLKLIKKERWNTEETDVFVKDDVTDEYSEIPNLVKSNLGNFSNYTELWRKYGKFLPSVCVIKPDDKGAQAFLSHLLLYAKFRNWPLRKEFLSILENKLLPALINIWRSYPSFEQLSSYLLQRKYLILQGPPGTGKTCLAEKTAKFLKQNGEITDYEIIQFHASTSYEDFVEGIKPDTNSNQLIFREHKGPLLEAIEKAEEAEGENKGYLLIIDEINRGDLAKILGEAIFLLEPTEKRRIKLRSGKEIIMPQNLYIIGTMNTADRTIAILDFAIRRRFAFVNVWPSGQKLEEILNEKGTNEETKNRTLEYCNRVQNIFFKYASDEELHLQPGHTYFIVDSEEELENKLKYEIAPLLQEYLNEGRLSVAKNEIISFIDEVLDK
ncbi:McrB family protein [Desulfurobacterium sp.]